MSSNMRVRRSFTAPAAACRSKVKLMKWPRISPRASMGSHSWASFHMVNKGQTERGTCITAISCILYCSSARANENEKETETPFSIQRRKTKNENFSYEHNARSGGTPAAPRESSFWSSS